jgi:hypothetical protein
MSQVARISAPAERAQAWTKGFLTSRFSGLAADACSLLLMQSNDGKTTAERALQILELGRGAISNLLIYDRSDISNLRAEHPDEADTFERLQMELNKPTLDSDVLRPPTVGELKQAAEEGTIIIVNVSDVRSDAILVTSSLIRSCQLLQLRSADVKIWLKQDLSNFTASDPGRKNKEYVKFLDWLWESCVEPVFQHLGFCPESTVDKLPRI